EATATRDWAANFPAMKRAATTMASIDAWRKARGRAAAAVAFATLIAIALAHASPARADADADVKRLVAATGLINAGKFDDAAKILEDLRRRDPANTQILR